MAEGCRPEGNAGKNDGGREPGSMGNVGGNEGSAAKENSLMEGRQRGRAGKDHPKGSAINWHQWYQKKNKNTDPEWPKGAIFGDFYSRKMQAAGGHGHNTMYSLYMANDTRIAVANERWFVAATVEWGRQKAPLGASGTSDSTGTGVDTPR
ncbi:hypothetical protein B0H14DRAFT_2556031 [Mycena olivaceomarginata]|nr:hypothetical protein B0H14DRAFT_2556031 [Mycena olivaceomarginata]